MESIPKEIANGCPDKCPVCGKECVMVIRTWKVNGTVSCEFKHGKGKDCKKLYLYK